MCKSLSLSFKLDAKLDSLDLKNIFRHFQHRPKAFRHHHHRVEGEKPLPRRLRQSRYSRLPSLNQ